MLDSADLAQVSGEFGVAEAQVLRDHFISHVLSALATMDLPIVFFGGTALARTWLAEAAAGGRLSEDIDLYTTNRRSVAAALDQGLSRSLRREFPGARWDPSPAEVRAVDAARLISREGLSLRIQLLSTTQHRELDAWPTEIRSLVMRYRDVPAGSLRTPTLESFVGMKTAAWMDRATARDLYDLAALARINAITRDVADLVRRVTGWRVGPYCFRTLPAFDWRAQLSHQTSYLPDARDCLDDVHAAYASALGWREALS